jgi:hypothetical protein
MSLVRRSAWLALALVVLVLSTAIGLTERTLHAVHRGAPSVNAANYWAAEFGATWVPASIKAADGVTLNGWLFQPNNPNGGAVLLLHGVNDTRLGVMVHARYLLNAGYVVLTPDSRNHGASGGSLITYGIYEADDTARWLRWLVRQAGIERVYGLGESMGAANLIQAAALPSPARAIVAECSFATFAEVADYRIGHYSGFGEAVAWPVRQIGFLYAKSRYGVDLWSVSPVGSLSRSRVPAMLIHGRNDQRIPPGQSRELFAARPKLTELWEVPAAGHVSAIRAEPTEMPRRVLAWFGSH